MKHLLLEANILPRMEEITRLVAATLGVEMDQLLSRSMLWRVVLCRQISMYLIRRHVHGVTLEAIGSFFNRHYTTVMYAVRQVENYIDVYPILHATIKELEGEIC